MWFSYQVMHERSFTGPSLIFYTLIQITTEWRRWLADPVMWQAEPRFDWLNLEPFHLTQKPNSRTPTAAPPVMAAAKMATWHDTSDNPNIDRSIWHDEICSADRIQIVLFLPITSQLRVGSRPITTNQTLARRRHPYWPGLMRNHQTGNLI